MQVTGYGAGYYGTTSAQAYATSKPTAATAAAGQETASAATIVTLSDAAKAASQAPSLAQLAIAVREKLDALLADAGRSSPLENGKLAIDLSSLSQRELHAIVKSDATAFGAEERKAVQLEMTRRVDAALSGPAAVAEITRDYRGLYQAAADYLDAMSPEQKAEPGWKADRAAIDKALKALDAKPEALPGGIAGDPVAGWLAARNTGETEDAASLGKNLRNLLDKRYAAIRDAGKQPTFDARSRTGQVVELGDFASRAISVMALNRDGLFSAEEVRAANAEIRSRANAAISEGYKQAAKSSDPTALARNVVAIYSSMSAEERQAAGISENLLNTAISSYQSTVRLLDIMSSGMNASGGVASWFNR